MNFRLTSAAALLLAAPLFAQYDAPAGYYASAEGLTGSSLKSALHNIIDGHTKMSYSAVWTALRVLDEDPANTNNILCLYTNRSIKKTDQDGSSSATYKWNREHSWPKSYGFNVESWPAYTDLHHLYASEKNINSTRNNHPYGYVSGGTTYAVIGSTSVNRYANGVFEAWNDVKGDVARSQFYMAVRYNGDTSNEPDLELTNTTSQIVTGAPKMGKLTDLLNWSANDPVDNSEKRRNHLIYTNYQGNRNPFIDRPQWIQSIFGGPTQGGGSTGGGSTGGGTTGGSTGGALTSGTAKTGTVTSGQWHHYTLVVNANCTQLKVELTGTSGDADLYVRRGAQPTSTAYDQRPYLDGSNETVTVANPTAATYYISVNGYASSNPYTLKATATYGTTGGGTTGGLTPTTTTLATNVAVASKAWKNYTIAVPSNATELKVEMTGTGDGDLYVRSGSMPTLTAYDARPYLDGSVETVTLTGAALKKGTTYYVSVYGYTAATVTIKATVK